jgi:hypothetical protein
VHPDLLHALARQRQAETLRQHQFRHTRKQLTAPRAHRAATPIRRVRRTLGTALVAAGSRLLGGSPPPVDVVDGGY